MNDAAWRGFFALVIFTARRQWRTRSLGLVSFALLLLMTASVAVMTHVQQAWRLETRLARVADPQREGMMMRVTYRDYAVERLPLHQMIPGGGTDFAIKTIMIGACQYLMVSNEAQSFRDDFAFISFSRLVVFGLFLSFLLPLFTLAFASGALGLERENRTLIWLSTRPLPRGGIYVAKFLGVLPWCMLVAFGGFAALCAAGGEWGRMALRVYWPSVLVGSMALTALFHFIGALFRRPAVVGLVYIFFFETLVANLPGSLKRLSLNYYVRSLLFNDAAMVAPSVKPGSVDVYDPLGSTACWIVLLSATVLITALGAWLFSRQEPKEEV